MKNVLTKLLVNDMKPALGVTEPGAIAFATAKARSYVKGDIESVLVSMNSGMYKNAFSCGIPNSREVGNVFASALGVVAGDCNKGLESLAAVNSADNEAAKKLIDEGRVIVKMSGITSNIFIEATVKTLSDECTVTIRDSHTNIVKIVLNGKTVYEVPIQGKSEYGQEEAKIIHSYTLAQLVEYVRTVPLEEIEFIDQAYKINIELFNEGLRNPRTTFSQRLFEENDRQIISKDIQKTAQLLCNAAIEARVIGLDKPAMSITGSGAHGIIATMPLYAEYKVRGLSHEMLLRATALSYLVCMYIKEYSGRLSAFCGCAIAAGTGMACALVFMRNGSIDQMSHTINNMASSITGMICDGGNQGCTMKGIVAVDAAFRSVQMAMCGVFINNAHGINASTPEQTMKHMGMIASPGMIGTEKTIVEILEDKLREKKE